MSNTSIVPDDITARTCEAAAKQRAEYIAVLERKHVLELCVGPSLQVLERVYSNHGISVVGNDIDARWCGYYPRGVWRIGDCFKIDWSGVDTIVFAPPLSRGCTGQRCDALMVDDVTPSYLHFLMELRWRLSQGSLPQLRTAVLVLPGRALATRADKAQTHTLVWLASQLSAELGVTRAPELVPLKDGRGRVTKYHDLYLDL